MVGDNYFDKGITIRNADNDTKVEWDTHYASKRFMGARRWLLLTFDDIIATARKPEACYSFSISVMSNPVMSLISPASIPFAFIF